jgi:hypothetical protein
VTPMRRSERDRLRLEASLIDPLEPFSGDIDWLRSELLASLTREAGLEAELQRAVAGQSTLVDWLRRVMRGVAP